MHANLTTYITVGALFSSVESITFRQSWSIMYMSNENYYIFVIVYF